MYVCKFKLLYLTANYHFEVKNNISLFAKVQLLGKGIIGYTGNSEKQKKPVDIWYTHIHMCMCAHMPGKDITIRKKIKLFKNYNYTLTTPTQFTISIQEDHIVMELDLH